MRNETLELIVRSAALPTMPQVVTRFLEVSADENHTLGDLVTLLSTDPGISSELLRLANSALFGVTRTVTSLQQAMTLLGMRRVRTLVLGRYLVERLHQNVEKPESFEFGYYWRRSLGTAVLAAKFADQLAPMYREEAFIGGLLTDIGVVVLMDALPDRYAPIASEYEALDGETFARRELQALGLTHAEVSALVLDRWMLPPIVVQAVHYHHSPDSVGARDGQAGTLLRIVSGSSRLSKLLCDGPDPDSVARACSLTMEAVGLDMAVLHAALEDMESTIRQLADLLRIEIISGRTYDEVANAIAARLAHLPVGK